MRNLGNLETSDRRMDIPNLQYVSRTKSSLVTQRIQLTCGFQLRIRPLLSLVQELSLAIDQINNSDLAKCAPFFITYTVVVVVAEW
ncbi:hypothetical protein TNCT_199141 [Trichonephila clavata]|uniref:Uncharacterized protein n=1 Tax=Trichonephila clavata TaxID=2740835 RepID=A0A8X6M039_TRICU|nr:hypothetical protein TNCT_199141 [Trichonephila clavata]